MKGSTVSVILDGYVVLGHTYNAVVLDGQSGMLSKGGSTTFEAVTVSTNDPAYEEAPEAMLASEPPMSTGEVDTLTMVQLAPLIEAAKARWEESGLVDAWHLEQLENLNIEISDLEGLYLGVAVNNNISIDINAAGYGWFIDSTPLEDEEFDDDYTARVGSDAEGRMDLLSVLIHEIGHVLGFGHDLDSSSDDVMDETLDVGTRVLLVTLDDDGTNGEALLEVNTLELPSVDEFIAALSESNGRSSSAYYSNTNSIAKVDYAGLENARIKNALRELFDENELLFSYVDSNGNKLI